MVKLISQSGKAVEILSARPAHPEPSTPRGIKYRVREGRDGWEALEISAEAFQGHVIGVAKTEQGAERLVREAMEANNAEENMDV